MKIYKYLAIAAVSLLMSACQENDFNIAEPIIGALPADRFKGELNGYDYTWTWNADPGLEMSVLVLNGNQQVASEKIHGNSYTHRNLVSNVEYTYVFKLTDGTNLSSGTVFNYTRSGAASVTGLMMSQLENEDGTYDAGIEWTPSSDADTQQLTVTSDKRNINVTLGSDASSYRIPNVLDGEELNVSITASNSTGPALPVSGSLRIGKTAIGFLSVYPTVDDLMKDGDDDEICAWLWLHATYPSAQYVYFGDISSADYLNPYRVLFWMRDLDYTGDELASMGKSPDDVVFTMPEVVTNATPYVREWYANGGSLLLWSHATVYIGELGRIPTDMLRSNDHNINVDRGGWNPDSWAMSVELFPAFRYKIDHSTHPVFKGIDVKEYEFERDGAILSNKRIVFKGPGFTEDHNCLFFNLPAVLTGLGNQDINCYNESVGTYGIIPLGTWDSQTEWISQLNVWEAQQGNTDFKGTIICVGNGGLNFSMKNADGSPDISAYPKNNPYQGNILKFAENALEYLKTR